MAIITSSENVTNILKSYLEAKRAVGKALRDSKNPVFSSKYTSYAEVVAACEPQLNENGIIIVHGASSRLDDDKRMKVGTRLFHVNSGEWIETSMSFRPVRVDKKSGAITDDSQTAGSCVTYGKRYTLLAIMALCEADDDGNYQAGLSEQVQSGKSSKRATAPQRAQAPALPAEPDSTASQLTQIEAMLGNESVDTEKFNGWLKTNYSVSANQLFKLKQSQAKYVIEALIKRIDEADISKNK